MTKPHDARIGQAPQHQQSPEAPVAHPGNIESFDYSKHPLTPELVHEKDLLGRIPDATSDELTAELRSPAAFRENPITLPATEATESKPRFTRTQKLIAAAAGFLTLGGGVLIGSQLGSKNDAPRAETSTSSTANSGPETLPAGEKVDISGINPETYKNIDLINLSEQYPGIQIDVMKPFIDAHIGKAFMDYIADIEKVNGYPMETGIPGEISLEAFIGKGSATDNAQQRTNRGGLLSYMSYNTERYTSDGQANKDLAKNIALYMYDTESSQYETALESISKDSKRVPTTLVASDNIMLPPKGSFAGYSANDLPTMVARVGGDVETNLNSEFVWQTRSGYNDKSLTENVFLGSILADKAQFITIDLNEWLTQQGN